ncbi:PREDICTED: UMP-CMP kinase-like [Amphimedon queenslandica]|uniref:UMP-CMP kinase n=1 Tax=Amphimedon queenslandica TaxID=400682 RepID=A0A1X7U2E0_AMPQE|nr:PREDICTED: UMP-CMP kinase-like [Amphimedon queenslandica]|eukprot:XP_003389193.1 PREDICTED: UMP-CMP kinase-like [Amphimedon queenslandica]
MVFLPVLRRAVFFRATKLAKPLVIFVLGGPGAGKGTQCSKIVEKYGFVHLSAGELLREARASDSEVGQLITSCMKEGKIVPVAITIDLLKKAMESSAGNNKFLIDGFPRNRDNLTGWECEMNDRVDFRFVLFFDCPETTCMERALKRGQESGRVDDNIESFKKRYKTYISDTMDIVNYYDEKGFVRKISSIPGPEEVFAEVQSLFSKESIV